MKFKILFLGFCISLPVLSFAIDGTDSTPAANNIIAAIQQLGDRIEALALAGAKGVTEMVHQTDRFFSDNSTALSTLTNQDQSTQTETANITQQEITESLLAFPAMALPANKITNPTLTAIKLKQNKMIDDLTINAPASDTLYASDIANAKAGPGEKAVLPSENYNQYFNFDSLMAAETLDRPQQIAANNFINYLTKNYQSFTDGIQFNAMLNHIQDLGNDSRESAVYINNVINDKKYKDYQLSIRSLLASRSVALSNFNFLLEQRMPNEVLNNTSPLQIEHTLINNTVGNPRWFKWLETNASPTTLAREQLLLTSLMVKQLQQLNDYNQRLLATLSLLTIQNGNSESLTLQTKERAVNQLITGQHDGVLNN